MADGSDDEISAEDLAFFKKRAKTASFLLRDQGADPEAKSKAQKRKEQERSVAARRQERAALDRLQGRDGGGGDGNEGEDEGPRHNRHWQAEAEKERKQALPVKLADGSMKSVMREQALPDPDDVVEQPAMSKRAQKRARGERIAEKKALERGEVYVKPGAKPAEETPPAEPAEGKKAGKKEKKGAAGAAAQEAERPLTHDEKKAAIADLCSKLMHDPEKNVALLTRVHQFCNDTDAGIVKMALLSEAMVFADILPDYRIRLPTEKEKEMKVSKEVAQQRAYEAGLLGSYQRFLQFLEGCGRKAEAEAKAQWERGGEAAVQGCMLAIVVSAMVLLQKRRPTFNFANNLLQSLARRADSPVPAIADMALSGLRDTIQNSPMNQHIKTCVELLAETVKKKQQRVNVQVLEVFLSLKITSDMLSGPNKKKVKGDTEEADEERELEASLMEGTATLAQSETKRLATIVLDAILTSYFRVLKFDPPASHLLPPVLEGLSRFAHLVNIDFFSDLLQAIKSLLVQESSDMEGERILSVSSSLHCVVCVFRCLKNQGEVWDLDLQDFYDVLFQSLLRIAASAHEFVHVPLLLDALRLTLYDMRQLSSDRVAGFAKRLLSLSLSLPPDMATAVLSFIRQLFTRYPKARRLVETDHACVGVYNPSLGNAELSNALASTAWEIVPLRCSFHPHLRRAAAEIGGMASESNQDEEALRNMISTKSAEALLRLYDTKTGGFNPPIKLPAPHPLRQVFEKRMKKKLKGQDTRAIELFVEQPKASQYSAFLRAVAGTAAPDACVKRVQNAGALKGSDMVEWAREDGGGGLFGARALKLWFQRHTGGHATERPAVRKTPSVHNGLAHALATGKKMHKGKLVGGESADGRRATNGVSANGVSKGVSKAATQPGGRSGAKAGVSKALKAKRVGGGNKGAGNAHQQTALKQKKTT